jgi:tetratricopeptide (TPR) repeat protein
MNCTEIADQEVLERYLLRQLSEAEQDAFEQHYFECNSCFEQLQIARAIQEKDGIREASEPAGFSPGSLRLRGNWINSMAVIGLLAGIVFAAWRYHARDNQPVAQVSPGQSGNVASSELPATGPVASPLIAELARIDPPPFFPIVLRGSESQASERFQDAMREYVRRDYASAIPGLRRVAQMDPQAANANFYLGACYLLINQTDLAIPAFEKTISLHEPNYAGQAHFYLAKAYIRKHDLRAAESELEKTVRLHSDREEEAMKLEKQLQELIPATD